MLSVEQTVGVKIEAGGPVRGKLTARVQMTDDSAGSGMGEEKVDLESILNGGMTGYVKV